MKYTYNIWLIIEKINNKSENGEDIITEKLAKFKTQNEAIDKAQEIELSFKEEYDYETMLEKCWNCGYEKKLSGEKTNENIIQ